MPYQWWFSKTAIEDITSINTYNPRNNHGCDYLCISWYQLTTLVKRRPWSVSHLSVSYVYSVHSFPSHQSNSMTSHEHYVVSNRHKLDKLVETITKETLKCAYKLPFVRIFHRWSVNSPHKWPVMWKRFYDVMMSSWEQSKILNL